MTHDTSLTDERNPVDVLADEFAARLRGGESPSVQEYVERFPQHASEIEELFPGVALLEQLSQKQESESAFAHRPRQDSLPPGHRFGDIEVIREVGRGGMGVVYEAYQHSLNRPVAVKAISSSGVHSTNQSARFQREAQAAAQLHHTNIVPVFGVGEQSGISYYVMQLIDGMGLDAILTELSRKTRNLRHRETASGGATKTVSARELADVLVSGQLSESSIRAATGRPALAGVDRDATAVMPMGPVSSPGADTSDQPVLEHRAENRTEDRTGEMSDADTPGTFVRSSLELRDDRPPSASIRSSLVLRDEIAEHETFIGTAASDKDLEPSAGIVADPSLASLGMRYWRNVARIGLQIASGLQYAHSQGTLHRDIKPANILLDNEGTAWIADFGLAKVLQQEDVTKTGDVVGTLRYMAPEQFRGQADGRSDLYSLGLTLYELLTLRPAYDDTDRQKLIAAKLTPSDPPRPRKLHPGIPRDLETIVLKCLAWEPDGRYQTAGALVGDIQAYLEDRPIKARRISPTERLWRWCRRNPIIAGLSTAVALLLLLITGLMSIGYMRAEERAQEMTRLEANAREGQQAALESARDAEQERAKTEQIADLQWDALNQIYDAFVPDRFAGPVEASGGTDETDEESALASESNATVLSPQTATMLEQMLTSFDKIAAIRGTDARYLAETAKANGKVGDLHLRLGQHQSAAEAFQRSINRYEELQQLQGLDVETIVQIARLHNGLGVANQYLGEPGAAQASLNASLAILTSSQVDPSDPTARAELAATHYLMGRRPPRGAPPPRSRGRDDEDRPPEDDRSPNERPRGRPQRPQIADLGDGPVGRQPRGERSETSRGGRGGTNRRGRGRGWDGRENREHLETAIAILAPLVEEFPDFAEYQFLTALCHIELANSWGRSSADEEANTDRDHRLTTAIDILTDLAEQHPEDPDYLYQLSEAHEQRYNQWKSDMRPLFLRQSDVFAEVEKTDPVDLSGVEAATADMRKARRISETLLRLQPNVPRYAESHVFLLYNLADVEAAQGELELARQHLADAATMRETIRTRFSPDENDSGGLRGAFYDLLSARVLLKSDNPQGAVPLLQSLVDRLEPDETDEKSQRFNPFRNAIQRWGYLILSEAHETSGDPDAAATALEQAKTLMPEPFPRHPSSDTDSPETS